MSERLGKGRGLHQEVSLHGHVDDRIEYQVTAASRNAFNTRFYEHDGHTLRLFVPGSEFIITPREIHYAGNGGSFCRYMFGIDPPRPDLLKPEVQNRLTLYGTRYRDNGSLEFTEHTSGSLNYGRVFLDGNAVTNYFFFVSGLDAAGFAVQQEMLLRTLGKTLKRSPYVGQQDDHRLLEEISRLVGANSTFVLIRLTHKPHRRYQEEFRRLYFAHKSIPEADYQGLCDLARRLEIDDYQQDRIRIDAMYHHRDNRRIVDEYRAILIACEKRGRISPQENARLNRLKNLWVRSKIPAALYHALDRLLAGDLVAPTVPRNEIDECRHILQVFIRRDRPAGRGLRREDMVTLLRAKQRSSSQRDRTFEQLLLETGQRCDELIRDGASPRLLEDFSQIVTYFDRFDSASAHVTGLAFMVNYRLTEAMLRSLLGTRQAFERLRPGLFEELLFDELRHNKYLSRGGREKIDILLAGLEQVDKGEGTLVELHFRLQKLGEQERLAQALLQHLKRRIRSAYSRFQTRNEQALLRQDLTAELQAAGLLQGELPAGIFEEAILWVQQEALYLNHLLPRILREENTELREEFLRTSGLDRFAVEELEREYCQLNRLDPACLVTLRTAAG